MSALAGPCWKPSQLLDNGFKAFLESQEMLWSCLPILQDHILVQLCCYDNRSKAELRKIQAGERLLQSSWSWVFPRGEANRGSCSVQKESHLWNVLQILAGS